MRTITTLLIGTTLLLTFFPGTAAAQSGTVLWTDKFGPSSYWNPSYDICINGSTVVTVGETWIEDNSNYTHFTVRAYNAETGAPIWTDQYNRQTGSLADCANAVATSGSRVFAAGYTTTTTTGSSFTVRAYDLLTGRVLWTRFLDREGTRADYASALAENGSRVFAAGTTETTAAGKVFTVRAFDTATGRVLWTRYYNAATGARADEARAITATTDKVFVAGMATTAANVQAFTVTAFAAATGTPLWSSIAMNRAMPGDARAIGVSGDKVIAAGHGGKGFGVAAFSTATGELAWTNANTPGEATALIISDKVYVTGTYSADNYTYFDMFTRALNPATGAVIWSAQFSPWPFLSTRDFAYDITVSNNKVFITGQSDEDDSEDITVAALNPATGAVLWYHTTGGEYTTGYGIAASSPLNIVIAAGTCWGNFTVEAYQQ